MQPVVTIVIPVHNCLPYLGDALASAYYQSLPREQIEVIAVDDGSTDGSSDVLAAWAARWPQLRVITQAASGSASSPRNVAIERARGEFLFFLDGDDCLGPEALERLVGYAREHGSDVVLGRLVGIDRYVPVKLFEADEPQVGLDSGIYYTLMPFKLVRRSVIMDNDIRFPEHMRISEDQPFIARCYLAARVISILASYPCYYLMRREGRSNTSSEGLPYATLLAQTDATVDLLTDGLPPGPEQAHVVARHLRVELFSAVSNAVRRRDPQELQAHVATAAPYANKWVVPGLDSELTIGERILVRALRANAPEQVSEVIHWIEHGSRARRFLVDDQWFLGAPGYAQQRHPRGVYLIPAPPGAVTASFDAQLDGSRLTLRGYALITGIPSSRCEIDVHLEHARRAIQVPVTTRRVHLPYLNALMGGPDNSYTEAGFEATAELDSLELGAGRWRLVVTIAAPELTLVKNVVPPPDFEPTSASHAHAGRVRKTTLREGNNGNLVVDVKPRKNPPPPPPPRRRIFRGVRRLRVVLGG